MPALSEVSKRNPDVWTDNSIIWGCLGDSIAAQNSSSIYLALESMGKKISKRSYAVGGTKIEAQAQQIPNMVADGCRACMIQVGTNNVSDSNKALVYGKYKGLTDALLAANIVPVYIAIPPKNTVQEHVFHVNFALYLHSIIDGVQLLNPWDDYCLVSGSWSVPTSNNDNVHPSLSVRNLVSSLIVDQVQKRLSTRIFAKTINDGFLSNPCFSIDSNSDGVGDYWTPITRAYSQHSLVSDGSNGRKKQRIVITNAPLDGSAYVYQETSISAGDKLRLSCCIDCDALDTLPEYSAYARIVLEVRNSGGSIIQSVSSYEVYAIGHGEPVIELTAIDGAASVRVVLKVFSHASIATSGTFTADFSRVTLARLNFYGL